MDRDPPRDLAQSRFLTGWCAGLACAALIGGCSVDPLEDAKSVGQLIERGELDQLATHLHPEYSDVIGDRTRLLKDLSELHQAAGRLQIRFTGLSVAPGANPSQHVDVVGTLEARVLGEPEIKLTGPLTLEYRRAGQLRLRSGLLADLRDIRQLMSGRRAALEGNDVQAMLALIHPRYREGDIDRSDVAERLEKDIVGVRIRVRPIHYLIDVRGALAHVDERYTLTANDRKPVQATARFTLKRSAGRWRIASGLYRPTN